MALNPAGPGSSAQRRRTRFLALRDLGVPLELWNQ